MSEPVLRRTARVVPVDPDGRVLLLQGSDPAAPDRLYWFTVGGGLEPAETPRAAAVRELREEVGIGRAESDLLGPFHHGHHDHVRGGVARRSLSVFFALAVDGGEVAARGLPDEGLLATSWWTPREVARLPLSNPGLPAIVEQAVRLVSRPGAPRTPR